MIKSLLLLFLVTVTSYTQEALIVGRRYYGVYIYSEFQSDAEALAEAYLTRGNKKHFVNRRKYHYAKGAISFEPLGTVARLHTDKETLYVVDVKSSRRMFIISAVPTMVGPVPQARPEQPSQMLRANQSSIQQIPSYGKVTKRSSS